MSPLRRLAVPAALLLAVALAAPAAAAELVVDNADGVVRSQGTWTVSSTTAGYYGGDYRFRTAGDGSATVTWPFPAGSPAGRYEVFARWSGGPNRAGNARYQITHDRGVDVVLANQRLNGGTWQSLGTYEFDPREGHEVGLSDKADGVVVADAIRWLGPLGSTAQSSPTASTSASPAATPTAAPATPTSSPVATGDRRVAAVQPAAVQPAAVPPAAATPVATTLVPTSAPPATAAPTAAAAASSPPAPSGSPAPSQTPRPADPRFFDATRYRVAEDGLWDFFLKRGGVRTFGYPVSNTFTLLGLKVQVFQRQILQQRPDGGVQTMNLLDEGLLPYTRMNGSTFPAPDPEVIKQAPRPDQPDYHERALQFVRDLAPDDFDGQAVGFARTFFGTVLLEDAFPGGAPPDSDGLLAGFNLEIWGLPTSRPTYDPSNRNFIYQRFQRGIMHYDKGCGCTQGLLLADYLKAIATTRNLPPDLAAQARGSRFFGQWAPAQPLGLARPQDLPASNWAGAFRRDPSITLDPGHGGKEIGTSATFPDGVVLDEKSINLRVALRLRELLEQLGYSVTMTRSRDTAVNVDGKDLTGDGKVTVSDDLQARVDIANRTRSDILVSVHFNGISDPGKKGTYVFWDPDRPFADRNRALAEMVQSAIVRSLKEAGYTTVDQGARTDTSVLGGGHYYLLSPKTEIVTRPSEMPAIIGEALFLTNPEDAAAARSDKVVEAVARGYLEGLKAYFARFPPD